MFTRIKNQDFDWPAMPKSLEKAFNMSVPEYKVGRKEEWFAIPYDGTTFSGHPTRTTLGNTFRSL